MAIDHNVNANAARYLSDLQSAVPAPPAMIVPVFLDVITAVDALHRRYNTACNLAPDKVVLQGEGKLTLEPLLKLSAASTIALPSLKYSSPEVLEEIQGTHGPHVSDSYILGFTFYEILLGRDLFQRQFAEVLQQGEVGWLKWHLDQNKPAQSLASQIAEFPPVLSGIIGGMMDKKTATRMSDLRNIHETLAESLNPTVVLSTLSINESRRKTFKIVEFIKRIVVAFIKAVRRSLDEENKKNSRSLSM